MFDVTFLFVGVATCLAESIDCVLAVTHDQDRMLGKVAGIWDNFEFVNQFVSFGLAGLLTKQDVVDHVRIGISCVIRICEYRGFCVRRTPHLLSDVTGFLLFGLLLLSIIENIKGAQVLRQLYLSR